MLYRAVFFDLFDTLVRFERDRLPEITIKGKTVRSTAGQLHAVLARHVPRVTLEACYEALLVSWKEAERLRAIDHREVTARERFAFFFPALGLEAAALAPAAAEGRRKGSGPARTGSSQARRRDERSQERCSMASQ